MIDPSQHAEEGPFGEFTGYSSDRSTHSRLEVQAVLRRQDGLWVDVVGGNSDEHLDLARVPQQGEMIERLTERFPCVGRRALPRSGTHFHCYLSVRQRRAGEARQAMLGLLGWDPYLKTVIAVDDDVDVTDDSEVLWALATRFQPAEDIMIVERLPGSALDPSSTRTVRRAVGDRRHTWAGVQRRPHPHLGRRASETHAGDWTGSRARGVTHDDTGSDRDRLDRRR